MREMPMKKPFVIILILLLALVCLFCYKENDTIERLGVNTEIVEINKDDKIIGVCYKGEDERIDLKFNTWDARVIFRFLTRW